MYDHLDPEHYARRDDALARVREAGVQIVELQFSDITGGAKSLSMPAGLLAATFDNGYRFDGSALTGLRQFELTLALAPDPETLIVFPPSPDGAPRRAQVACSVRRLDGGAFPGDPRGVLIRTLEKARELGFDYHAGIEIEYYLVPTGSPLQRVPAGQSGASAYFDANETIAARIRSETIVAMHDLGIACGGAHHETGPGQEELDLDILPALRTADHLITARQLIKRIAQRHGMEAIFMPKPFEDAPGSGMHLFQRLLTQDGGDYLREYGGSGISVIARNMIAGQLAHAAGMLLVLCPAVNSYKRLNAGHRAPRHATWAQISQASLIRVPNLSLDQHREVEVRCPDALANPYLALAAALGAALAGIRAQEEPPDPLDEGLVVYDDSELQRRGIPRLPATLGDAISAFAEDRVVQETLGDFIADQLLTVKRAEWEDYRRHVSPWEIARYRNA